jgi:hypothetical protein
MVTGWTNAGLANIAEQADNWTSSGTGGGFAAMVGEKAVAGAVAASTATLTTGSFKALLVVALQSSQAPAQPLVVAAPSAASYL